MDHWQVRANLFSECHLPDFRKNLVSVGMVERVGAKVKTQGKMKFYLNDHTRMEAQLIDNNLYELK